MNGISQRRYFFFHFNYLLSRRIGAHREMSSNWEKKNDAMFRVFFSSSLVRAATSSMVLRFLFVDFLQLPFG